MKFTDKRLTLFYIALLLFIVVVVLVLFSFSNSSTPSPAEIHTSPTKVPAENANQSSSQKANPPEIGDLPKDGVAINTEAPVVQDSAQEVGIARRSLPYLHDFTASTGKEVSIVIPSLQYQDDPWKLTVNIFGPEYRTPSTSSTYAKEKQTFLDGANEVYRWIATTGADPNKVIIKWGDRAYIQEKAEEWLTTP